VQASHHAIAAHRLVVLAEVNTVSLDWGNLLFKLSLAEALEEVAARVAEEAWLYNEYAFYFCFYYIHCFNLCSLIRISKIIPSFFTIKEGFFYLSVSPARKDFFRKPTRPSLPLRKAPPLISVFSPQARRRKPPYSVLYLPHLSLPSGRVLTLYPSPKSLP